MLLTRRQALTRTGLALGASVFGLPLTAAHRPDEPLRVVVTGAHPDDPESGCGGLIARLTAAGHRVTIVYLTRGEAGIPGTSADAAATTRSEEARMACELLGATPVFLGQVDGATYTNPAAYTAVADRLRALRPQLLLTHWPIDTHRDHRACSMLTYAAWLGLEERPDLYFYEVVSGGQTQNFAPTNYVDISPVRELKHAACFVHVSQRLEEIYAESHGRMEVFRGMESGHGYAEAFVRHWWNFGGWEVV